MKIKEIKIVNQDESTEVADIGADAVNVDYNDTTVKAELDKLNATSSTISNEQIRQGNTLSNLESEISSLASGSPKGAYETTAALISANPDTGVYIVTADGHIYSWTKNASSAIDLGVYQAREIEDWAITKGMLGTDFRYPTNNYYDKDAEKDEGRLPGGSTINTPPNNSTESQHGYWVTRPFKLEPNCKYKILRDAYNSQYGWDIDIETVNFYNASGNLISRVVYYYDTEYLLTPANTKYCRMEFSKSKNVGQVKKYEVSGYTPEYEPYFDSKFVWKNDVKWINDNVNLESKLDKISDIDLSNHNWIDGAYLSKQTGAPKIDQWSTNFSTSDFIGVFKGQHVYLTHIALANNNCVAIYDSEYNLIKIIEDESDSNNASLDFVVDEDRTKYFRFGCSTAQKENVTIKIDNESTLSSIFNLVVNPGTDEDERVTSFQNNTGITISNGLYTALNTPIVSWIDDDTPTINAISKVYTICNTLGIKCSFACVTNKLVNTELLDTLKQYQNEGFNILTHSHTHGQIWKPSSEEYDPGACEPDLIQSLVILQQEGFLNNDFLVTPFGTQTAPIKAICKKWCKALITASGTTNHRNTPNRYALKRPFITKTNDLEQYKDLIDTCYEQRDWLIFGTHSNTNAEWDDELVQSVFEYAQTKGCAIMPINEAWKVKEPIYTMYDMFT